MLPIILAVVVVVAVTFIYFLAIRPDNPFRRRPRGETSRDQLPYRTVALLTPNERSFFGVLSPIAEAAGLPLLRVPVKSGYVRQEMERLIHDTLAPATSTTPPSAAPISEVTPTLATPALETNTANKRCPRCGAALVVRNRRSSGEQFLGCQSYPNCRYTEPLKQPADLASSGKTE